MWLNTVVSLAIDDDYAVTPPTSGGELPMPASKIENYRSRRGAEAYKQDYRRKVHRKVSDRIERRILRHYFARVGPLGTVLDLPCGAGRLFGFLQEFSAGVVEADFSPSMLDLDRSDHENAARAYVQCSALEAPFADRSFDAVVSIRLCHHLDREVDRERYVREILRVADRVAVFTWFSRTSLKNLLRELRRPFTGKRRKNVMGNRRVFEIARECGFTVAAARPLSRLGSGHVLGLFVRGDRSPVHSEG